MGVSREEVVRAGVSISEVAAPAAGDGNLLADSFCVFQYEDSAPALACFNRAKETGRSRANDYDIPFDNRKASLYLQRQRLESSHRARVVFPYLRISVDK
jgi:hypothetical protein